VHPAPDKSTDPCAAGIHLARTLEFLFKQKLVVEFYEAYPGVILGEDSEKVRCASCYIIRRIPDAEIADYKVRQMAARDREALLKKLNMQGNNFLVDQDWIIKSATTFTEADFNKLSIEVKGPHRTITMTTKFPTKEGKAILHDMVKAVKSKKKAEANTNDS